MKKKTKSRIEFKFFKIFYKINKKLPYPFVEKSIINLSKFAGNVLRLRRNVAESNLKKIYPDKSKKERNMILTKMYENLGRTAAETYFGDREELLKKCETRGFENISKALEKGNGVILATFHMGNWELAGVSIAKKYKMGVVLKKQRNRYFDDFTNKLRENENIVLIDKKNALRPIIQLLKQNYVVSILMDQNAGKHGIRTNFLGLPSSTFVGTAKIAIKQKCPIIPAITYRNDKGENIFIVEAPVDTTKFTNNIHDIKALTELVSGKLEKYIHEHPADWFWVHKRWKGAKKAKFVETI